jgi:hypothetical protein
MLPSTMPLVRSHGGRVLSERLTPVFLERAESASCNDRLRTLEDLTVGEHEARYLGEGRIDTAHKPITRSGEHPNVDCPAHGRGPRGFSRGRMAIDAVTERILEFEWVSSPSRRI